MGNSLLLALDNLLCELCCRIVDGYICTGARRTVFVPTLACLDHWLVQERVDPLFGLMQILSYGVSLLLILLWSFIPGPRREKLPPSYM